MVTLMWLRDEYCDLETVADLTDGYRCVVGAGDRDRDVVGRAVGRGNGDRIGQG